LNEIRQKKIEREIQRTIASLIISEKVKDPRISMTTIHRVELAPDMSIATIFYTAYCNNNERKKLSQGLVSATGFMQAMIGKKLNLRYTPRLKFVWDKDYIKSIEVNQLIDDLAPKKPLEWEEEKPMRSDDLNEESQSHDKDDPA
jgi:ribosome-binding factor A